jgi:hypothetical protein
MTCVSLSLADHHAGPIPDAEEDAPVPEGAQQGVKSHTKTSQNPTVLRLIEIHTFLVLFNFY